jgi:hypothetical protein
MRAACNPHQVASRPQAGSIPCKLNTVFATTVSSVRSLHWNLFEKIEHGPQMMFVDISDERDNILSNLQPPRFFDGILAGKGDT